MAILGEKMPFDEKLKTIYVRSLKNDVFNGFKPRLIPPFPSGYLDALNGYKQIPAEKKSDAWRRIQNKYFGYLKSRNEAEMENCSNKAFLEQMANFFEKENMFQQRDQVKSMLQDYEQMMVAA